MESEVRITTRVIQIDPRRIKLLDQNAQYMTHEQFEKLVANIKRDGTLTQIPFGWRLRDDNTQEPIDQDGEPVYEVLSGNHRTQAAIAAGLTEIDFQVSEDYLIPDQRAAIQISHNEITGQADPAILKVVYEGIDSIEWRLYSGVDDNRLELLANISADTLHAPNLEFQTISMLFLPDELDQAKLTWDKALESVKSSKAVWVLRWSDYDAWMDAIEVATKTQHIKNIATAARVVLNVFRDNLDDLDSGWLQEDYTHVPRHPEVPIDVLVGYPFCPTPIATKLRRVMDQMISRGEIKKDDRWKAFDRLADLYLGETGKRDKGKQNDKKE